MLTISLRNKFVIVGNERRGRQEILCWTPEDQEGTKSVFYEEVRMYNSLPVGIKQRDGLRTFKCELREYILNRMQDI